MGGPRWRNWSSGGNSKSYRRLERSGVFKTRFDLGFGNGVAVLDSADDGLSISASSYALGKSP